MVAHLNESFNNHHAVVTQVLKRVDTRRRDVALTPLLGTPWTRPFRGVASARTELVFRAEQQITSRLAPRIERCSRRRCRRESCTDPPTGQLTVAAPALSVHKP